MSDGGGGEDGGGGGGGGMEVSAAVQTVADASVLQKHIRKLVPLLLEDGGDAPASLESALEEKSALEQMRKFLSDSQVHSILVERSALKGDATVHYTHTNTVSHATRHNQSNTTANQKRVWAEPHRTRCVMHKFMILIHKY